MLRTLRFAAAVVVALALGARPASANLITNGSFETGDFTGWTEFDNILFNSVACGDFFGVLPTDGSCQAVFGPFGSTGGITQTIATVAGQTYDFSFDLYNLGAPPNSFDASFGGGSVLSFTDAGAFPYTHYAFSVLATGALTGVTFTFLNNPSFWLLDNVVIEAAAVPEPATLVLTTMGLLGYGIRRRRAARA
jgi:hypothetical protein